MKPTEEQIKEIEERASADAQEHYNNCGQPDDQGCFYDFERGYIAGATDQLEKFPCSPEELKKFIQRVSDSLDCIDYTTQTSMNQDIQRVMIDIETFLNKLK